MVLSLIVNMLTKNSKTYFSSYSIVTFLIIDKKVFQSIQKVYFRQTLGQISVKHGNKTPSNTGTEYRQIRELLIFYLFFDIISIYIFAIKNITNMDTKYRPRIAEKLLKRKLVGKGAVLLEGPKWSFHTI